MKSKLPQSASKTIKYIIVIVVVVASVAVAFVFRPPVSVWLTLLALLMGYLGIHMSAHPPKEEEKAKKRFYKLSFSACALLTIGLAWYQSITDNKEKTTNQRQISMLTNQVRDLQGVVKDFGSKLIQVNSLRDTFDDLILRVSKSLAACPEAKQTAIDANRQFQALLPQSNDLNEWFTNLTAKHSNNMAVQELNRQIAANERFKPIIPRYKTNLIYFEHFFSSFTNMLSRLAKIRGDVVEYKTLEALPSNINSTMPKNIWLAKINLKNDVGCFFRIMFSPEAQRVTILYQSGLANISITSGTGHVVAPNLDGVHFNFSEQDYREVIDKQLEYLIGYVESTTRRP